MVSHLFRNCKWTVEEILQISDPINTDIPPMQYDTCYISEISDEMDNRYKGKEMLHEAGYDAYITGQCYISLANYLG